LITPRACRHLRADPAAELAGDHRDRRVRLRPAWVTTPTATNRRWKKSTVDKILAEANWAALSDDREDDVLVIPVDDMREIVKSR